MCFKMSSHLSSVLISLSILIRGMHFQFGVIERATVEIICVWSILLFITCWIKFAQGLKNETQLRGDTEMLILRVLVTGKSYEDLNIVLQFILNNSWSVYCYLKIQDSYLRIRIKRRIFKDKIPNMTGSIWSTCHKCYILLFLTCYIMYHKVERSSHQYPWLRIIV